MPRKNVSEVDKDLVLRQLRRGKQNAVTARGVAIETNLLSDRTDIHVRSVISELIVDGHAIGSYSGGFYLIDTEDELAEVIEGIQTRVRGMQARIRRIRANFRGA
jgi:hypothetical protein